MAELRVLIDYANGDNWVMSIELYERYYHEAPSVVLVDGKTKVECWLDSLSQLDRITITKK